MRYSFVVPLLLLACPAWAQIQVKEKFDPGEPIVAAVPADQLKDAALDWRAQQIVTLANGVEVIGMSEAGCIPVDGGRVAHLWANAGKYRIELTIAAVVDGRATIKREHATFTVGTPPPVVPPGPAPPGPQPPGPNPPPSGLAALVPDPAHRAMLAEFYGDLAAAVRAGQFASTSHFREGYRKAIEIGKANGTLPQGLSAINKPISDRIVAAITLADTPLDEAKKSALAVCLEGVAAEFKG